MKKREAFSPNYSEKGVKPSKEVLKRFFADGCPSQEVQTVYEWFATAHGQKYVSKEVDKDFKLLNESFESAHTCNDKIDSAKIYDRIFKLISQKSSKD